MKQGDKHRTELTPGLFTEKNLQMHFFLTIIETSAQYRMKKVY
jgi:hypothetical protein